MKPMLKKIFSIAALFSFAAVLADGSCGVTTCYSPRSQGRDKVRQMVGTVGHVHLFDMESYYGQFSIMPEYTQSFRPSSIARCLFGSSLIDNCDCPGRTIRIQGSGVANRAATSWLADYFYLPTDWDSTITFEPKIRNFILDFDLYVGLDEWANGLYFRIYGPFVHTRWDLNFCESITAAGTAAHTAGYFSPAAIARTSLLGSFASYARGNAPATIAATANSSAITFQGLCNCRIDCDERTENGFADLRMELGWNFLMDEDYHLGLNVQAAAPTGGRKGSCYAFDALVGNGNHWELGGGLTAHYVFWRSEDAEKHFGFYFDANITHMFKTEQTRCFDLCNKPVSRYMLAQRMTRTISNGLVGANAGVASAGTLNANQVTAPNAQFDHFYAPVANISTIDVDVSVGVQADIVAMFNYTSRGFSWDIGYNFWGRSCESIECPTSCPTNCTTGCTTKVSLCDAGQENTWVLKGDARNFGFVSDGNGALNQFDPIALSSSQNDATIFVGTNAGSTNAARNFGVDNATDAYGDTTIERLLSDPAGADAEANHIRTSVNPVFLSCSSLNLQETKGISHKVFTHFSYNWDRENWMPYLGVGGFAEFGKKDSSCCTSSCDTACNTSCTTSCNPCDTACNPCDNCIDCSLSQWGVWVKGGVSFN